MFEKESKFVKFFLNFQIHILSFTIPRRSRIFPQELVLKILTISSKLYFPFFERKIFLIVTCTKKAHFSHCIVLLPRLPTLQCLFDVQCLCLSKVYFVCSIALCLSKVWPFRKEKRRTSDINS